MAMGTYACRANPRLTASVTAGIAMSELRISTQSIHMSLGVRAFHEKAGECQVGFSFSSLLEVLHLSQAASVATLPSALFVERLSLGASWVYSIQ